MAVLQSSALNNQTVWQLRSFCRGELAAAEAYTTALSHDVLSPYASVLRGCQASHATRANILRGRIEELGGSAPTSSGAWGAFVDVIEEAAADLGVHAALRALEEGESHGLRDYHADLKNVDDDTQSFIWREILPGQLETRRAIESLRKALV